MQGTHNFTHRYPKDLIRGVFNPHGRSRKMKLDKAKRD